MVLLKNDPVGDVPLLPLAPSSLHRVAIVGHLAAEANLGDRGSSLVRPPTVSTVLNGIREALPRVQVDHAAAPTWPRRQKWRRTPTPPSSWWALAPTTRASAS